MSKITKKLFFFLALIGLITPFAVGAANPLNYWQYNGSTHILQPITSLFAKLAVPSTPGGAGCLQIDGSGNFTSTGASCGTGGGSITIGDPVIGGTANEVLYADSNTDIGSDANFTRDELSAFHTTIKSSTGSVENKVELDANTGASTLSATDGLTTAFTQANATSHISEWTDNSRITSFTTLDIGKSTIEHDNNLVNAYYLGDDTQSKIFWTDGTVNSFATVDGTIATIRLNDPNADTQSYFEGTNTRSTVKWRNTNPGTASAVLSAEDTSTYLNWGNGLGVTGTVTANVSGINSLWTDGSTITSQLNLNGTQTLLSFIDSSQNDRPTLEQGTHFMEGKVVGTGGMTSSIIWHSNDLNLSVDDMGGDVSLVTLDATSSTVSHGESGGILSNAFFDQKNAYISQDDGGGTIGVIAVSTDISMLPTTTRMIALDNGGNQIILSHPAQINLDAPKVEMQKTIIASGTTGDQTINKPAGSVNFAALATSLTVTNSTVNANSVIMVTVDGTDVTMSTATVTKASGLFVITPNNPPTAETRVDFLVIN